MSVGPFNCEDPIDWKGMENEKKQGGRASDLKEMVFKKKIKGRSAALFFYCPSWVPESVIATLEPESYEILWQNKISALVKISFKPWKYDDEYEYNNELYRYEFPKLVESEIVFVVKKSLNGLKEKKGS